MFYIVEKIVMGITCYVDIFAIWAWVIGSGAEIFIAMVLAVIAGCALAATIMQGRQNRKHNEISVRPLLTIRNFTSRDDTIMHANVELVNCGFGPARIISVVIFDKGEESDQDYYEFAEKKLESFMNRRIAPLERGVIIKKDENYLMASVKFLLKENNIDFIKELDIEIKYQSIYKGEVFTYDSRIEHDKTEKDSP